jgi:2',3'-cyclic-nucleotide 2'-phosphodiesterase/3'-nucleotidase
MIAKKRLLSLLLAVALVFSIAISAGITSFAAPDDTFTFRILFTSDLHGSFSDWRYSAGNSGAGLARIATQIESRRTANTLLIDVGDSIQGNGTGLFHSADWDNNPANTSKMYPVIYGLEHLKYDVWVLGNHEFNFGMDRLDKSYGKDINGPGKHGFSGAILAGNVFADVGNIYGLPEGTRIFNDFFIKKYDDGPTVAVVGMVHGDIVNWDHGNVVDAAKLYTTGCASETQKTIAYLKSAEAEALYGKIDIFVGAQHVSSGSGQNGGYGIINANPEIDLFLGAHGHSATNNTSTGVRYMELSGNAGQLGQVDVKATQQLDGSWKVVNRISDVTYTAVSPGSTSLSSYRNNAQIVAMHDLALAYSQLPVGTLTGGPMVASTVVRGSGNNFYTFDSALTHLFHNAFQYYGNAWVDRNPEHAATGRRVTLSASCPLSTTNLQPGSITRASVGQIYNYDNNTLCIIELTGYQVKVLAEYGYSSGNAATATANCFFPTGTASNSYDRMMIDGITYKVDSSRTAWNRVYDMRNPDGTPFDLDGVYWMAANNHTTGSRFFASGSSYALQRLQALPDTQKLHDADGNLVVNPDYGAGQPIVRTWNADEILTVNGESIFNAEGCTGVVADYVLRVLGGNLTNQFTPNWRYDTTSIPSSDWGLYNKAVQIVNANIGVNINQATPANIRAQLNTYAQPLWDLYLESLSLVKADYAVAKWSAFTAAREAAGQALLNSGYTGSAGSVTQTQVEAASAALAAAIVGLTKEDVVAGVTTNEVSDIKETVEFLFSLRGLDHVNTAAFEFTLAGGNLRYEDMEAMNNFVAMPIRWTEQEDGQWKGSLTIACLGNTVTSTDTMDVIKLLFNAIALGDATMTIDSVTVTMQPEAGGEIITASAVTDKGTATTSVIKVYSVYDLTRDGVIGQADFAIVALACGITEEDPRWNQTIATVSGRAITPAMCDINGDGEVDMLDLMAVFLHYAEEY